MKKIYLFSFIISSCIFFLSNSSGRATVGNEGTTGAPGESTCGRVGCHSGGNFSPSINMQLEDTNGNLVTSYIPGVNYTLNFTINSTGNPAGYGYQLLSLDDNGNAINNWSNPSQDAKIVSLGTKDYVEQKATSNDNTMSVTWQAPAAGSGDVTFYGVGNAVNVNNNTLGDGVATSNLSIAETTSSTAEVIKKTLVVYPNPFKTEINISDIGSYENIRFFNFDGQLLNIRNNNGSFDFSNYQTGLYLLMAQTKNNVWISKKIYKE